MRQMRCINTSNASCSESHGNMAEDGLLTQDAPPDIYYKCHPAQPVQCVICAVCNNIYHKSDYAKNKIRNYLNSLYIICEEHRLEDITSKDPCVARILQQKEMENLNKQNKKLQDKYTTLMRKYEDMVKEDKITKQKLKQAEHELNLKIEELKNTENKNTTVDVDENIIKQISTEVHNNSCILKQLLEKENVFKSKRTYAEALTKDKLLEKKIPKLIVK